ncbi:hypothetical protein RND81_12G167900 [Saponaria officinalis]|uniref:Protein kinase domain-containing protein n=1 Tax=Saponaria officinalis TaxID=3572 RepID=A0AAW1HBN9_SAPOF
MTHSTGPLPHDCRLSFLSENGTTFAQYVTNYTVILDFSETELTMTFTPLARSCNSKGEELTGCHHYGLVRAKTRTGRKVTSCVALCTEQEDLKDGTCSGVGCCEAPLPKGLQDVTSILEKIIYNTTVSSGKCGYSFLSRRSDQILPRAIDLEDPDFFSEVRRLPGVLDWFIANATCKEAQKKSATNVFAQVVFKEMEGKMAPGVGIGLGSVLFIIGGYWLFIIAKRRQEVVERAINFKKNGGLLLKQKMSSKEGGQGTVYKGMLSDGNLVAIKKSKKVGASHVGEFINEVVILSQINHRNIVKSLGCCLETEIPLLVYEYVPNGTLSGFIYDLNEDFPITWEMRQQIAIDVAGALNYLHSSWSNPIFHRDVKASNILLDAKYRAKLSDFGSSRSIAIDQTYLTTRVQGTFGYIDLSTSE